MRYEELLFALLSLYPQTHNSQVRGIWFKRLQGVVMAARDGDILSLQKCSH